VAAVEPIGWCIPRGDETRLGLLLSKVGAVLIDQADEALAPAGVDGRDYGILSIIATDNPSSQLELAQLMGKAPALVVGAIDELESRGLVERTRDPADRRRSRVRLTAAGERALERADEIAGELVAEMLSGLNADGIEQLRGLLMRGMGIEDRTGSALPR